MASPNTIKIVKSTAPVLLQHGEAITKVFYQLIFEKHPTLKNIFNMTHQKTGSQPKVLANTIFQYASHIDKLELLTDTVASIAQKHASLSITAEMYPIVGENLLLAIKTVLGDAATPEIIDAWAEAYGDLAAIFVQTESDIYEEQVAKEGGFKGKKTFTVVKKVEESEVITSFYLQPSDGSNVSNYLPGQYISLAVEIPEETHLHSRNYSLSDFGTTDHWRISVKKEVGNPNGIVSNYLHASIKEGDSLSVGMPAGVFTLKDTDKPVVLIAGGVGITPILSMYKALAKAAKRPVYLIQCALNSQTQAFQEEIKSLTNEQVRAYTIFNTPVQGDELGKTHDFEGFLSKTILETILPTTSADFYFCGPTPFMANTLAILTKLNVPEAQINYEFFGPQEVLESI